MKSYLDKVGLQDYTTKLTAKNKTIFATKNEVGSPLVAATAAAMTDTNKIYVYVGSEAGYTSGNWYYYNGSAWTSGGVYNSQGFVLDDTLTSATMPAQAKAAGDAISQLSTEIESVSFETSNLVPLKLRNSATANGVTLTVNGDGTYSLSGTATADVRFDLYGSTSAIPEWLTRGTEYYCVVYGREKTTVSILGYNDSFVEIARNFDALTLFTCPASGGFYLSVFIDSGVQYNETIRIVIMAKTSIADGVYNGTENIDKIERMLTESNLDVNFAVASTASKVHNGITFTADGGTVTVNGTSTGVAYFDLFNNINEKNEFPFKTGKKYAIRFNEQDTTLIYKQVEYKTTSSSEIVSLYSKRDLSDTIIFTMPECYLFYIRIVCDSAGQIFDNKQIVFTIEEIPDDPNVIIVDVNGGGDFRRLKDAVEFAMLKYGTRVIVKRGLYDLVGEFGKTYLDNLSGDDYGIMLGNGIELIFAPNAYVSFDYDGTNSWVIANFSPFNTANDLGFTIDGLHCTARNCRYILHDDPRPAVKDQYSYNTIKNCYFSLFSSPSYTSWVNHQIIGGGFGDSTMVVIENCIFNDHFTDVSAYSAVSYHNSTSGASNYESRIIVKDNYFSDGNRLTLEGYGTATSKSKAIITGNCFQDAANDFIYNSSNADNIDIYRWNNQSR